MTVLPVARTMPVQEWMGKEGCRAVMGALQEPEVQAQALFVGGCVRNSLLGLPVGDIDIATIHPPQTIIQRLKAAGLKVVPTGIEHGTVTAVAEGRPYEVTTLRRDVETDGRRAVVAFSMDWREDAERRDFTINTLLADPWGNVYDPTGRGIADLEARRVVFVGNATDRINEDSLRILRYFRFLAAYGEGEPDAEALAACRAGADKILSLSRERITQELSKIMMGRNPAGILRIMFDTGVAPDLMHPDCDLAMFAALVGLQDRIRMPMLEPRLAMLGAGRSDHEAVIDRYFILSNQQKKLLEHLTKAVRSPTTIKERLYLYGRHAGGQSLLMLVALMDATISNDDLEIIRSWPIPVLPVTGADLQALGVEQGPRVGALLREIEQWWIEWDFQPDHAQCIARAREIMA